jgi:hypothetical protein
VVLLLASAARADDKADVQRAVDRGVAYLKGLQQADGSWRYEQYDPGATALCGLALLESGVGANDRAVQRAAQFVRAGSVACTKTYALSLAIMFLDRLGDPADTELIEAMTARLLGGQDAQSGGWSYECPLLGDAEVRRLQAQLQAAGARPAAAPAGGRPPAGQGRPKVQDLPREIQRELQLVAKFHAEQAPTPPGVPVADRLGDNSNTQFAIFALWIGRRKGIPVEDAMQRAEARFRKSQQPDGGWKYTPPAGPVTNQSTTPAMTCAGLITLALSHGTALEAEGQGAPHPDPSTDPAVRKGLLALGSWLGHPPEGTVLGGNGSYYLYSLERVGVAYGLETVGDTDWYARGADALRKVQHPDGSWTFEYGKGGVDTAFALLFLGKANLAQDLSVTLRGRVRDPGHELRSVDLQNLGKGEPPKEARPAAPPARPAPDAEVGRLSDELVKADAARQAEVLQKLRDGKGGVYTDALAHAIRRLDGAPRGKARDALADRLARMSARTLSDKLQDDDLEVRRAAALACAMRDEKAHVPRLIELLQDPEAAVARAAHAALKSLTNQDFGPGADAGQADVARAVAAWKDWWARNGGK